MVREIPDDGNRYECIDGELLVTPSPGNLHQSVVGELYQLLAPYVRGADVGYVQVSPLDVELDDDMIVQPDILAFRIRPVGSSSVSSASPLTRGMTETPVSKPERPRASFGKSSIATITIAFAIHVMTPSCAYPTAGRSGCS